MSVQPAMLLSPDFTNLLDALANGVVIADSTGTIMYSNQFLEDMFGYMRGELLGQSVEVLIPADLRGIHVNHRAQYSVQPETRLMGGGRDLRGLRKDKSTFPVEVGLSPIKTAAGLQIVAIVTDITKRKYAEQQSNLQKDIALILSRAESVQSVASKLLETITTALGWSAGMFWLVDSDSGAFRCTAIWRMAGAEPSGFEAASQRVVVSKNECLLGQVWATGKPLWVPDLTKAREFERTREAASAGLRSAFELPIRVGNQVLGIMEFFSGDVRPSDEAIIEIATTVGGQIGQYVERLRTERALGISEERYRSLFANAVFGILRTTASGEILDANPALVSMLGYNTVEEVLRLNVNEHIYRNVQDRSRLLESTTSVDRFEGFEDEWKTRKGEALHVRLSGRPLHSADGKLAGYEAIVENVTQRKLLEEQYRRAQKLEAIGRLAGGVAHDFNNLLTIIAVSTDTLLDQLSGNDSVRQTIEEIDGATEQGASLVRQLMAFSRVQSPALEVVSLADVLRSSERMLRILAGEGVEIRIEAQSDQCFVKIERSKLEQIFMNLVANSRDAMPGGGRITIALSLADIDNDAASLYVGLKPRRHVKLSVGDTGGGIPPEVLSHIFEPFFTTKEKGKGTGLGLPTVYGIVSQSEGYIGCESITNQGTTFTIFLPAAEQKTVEPATTPQALKPQRGTEKILLVEDEPTLRASVRRVLEKNGYVLTVASDGQEALKILDENDGDRFDLILTDIALPHMRGTELAERALSRYAGMKVLFMSGYAGDSLPPNAAHFIPKPFRLEALVRKIRETFDS